MPMLKSALVLNAWISDEPFLTVKCLFVAVSIREHLNIATVNIIYVYLTSMEPCTSGLLTLDHLFSSDFWITLKSI